MGVDSGEFDLEGLEFEQCREAGPVHVGHQMWERLGQDQILSHAGLSDDAQLLSQLMTLNRLIAPRSELAMSDWIQRTATEFGFCSPCLRHEFGCPYSFFGTTEGITC